MKPANRGIGMAPFCIIGWFAQMVIRILTACGPHEVARELRFEDEGRRGALSYFLLSTLSNLGNNSGNQHDIYRYLCARFRESWPKQNPMLFGNRDLYFFAQRTSKARTWS